jgi:hypothetical protein
LNGVSAVRQTESHTPEPRLRAPSAFELGMAIEKLKRRKSPGIDQIPSELFKAGGRTILYEVNEIINSVWKKESIILFIFIKG